MMSHVTKNLASYILYAKPKNLTFVTFVYLSIDLDLNTYIFRKIQKYNQML